MKKFIYILFALITISSCISPLEETCSLPVAGLWVSVDEAGFVSQYIEFKNGNYKAFTTEKPAYYNERTIWAANKSDFIKVVHDEYSIIDGILYTQNAATPISFNNDILVIGKDKFYTLRDFNPRYYSTISCDNPKQPTFKYSSTEVLWDYEISNRPLGNKIEVTADVDWINTITVTEQKLSFKIDENNSGKTRKAILTLSYPTANPLTVEIEQTFDESKVILSSPSVTCDYNGGEFGFSYVIDCPRDGQFAEVSCESEWISDLTDSKGNVRFNVPENNSGLDRTCDIVVSYGNVQEIFKVTQTYSATRIELSPKHIDVDYRGAQYCYFDCRIENPRQNCTIDLSCDSDWIQEINVKRASDTYSKVEFNVKENNDIEPERIAEIRVNYGELSDKVSVVQTNAQPVIRLGAPSIKCAYTEDSYGLSYTIENPRESVDLMVSTKDTWITDLHIGDETVSFRVSENNSGNRRIGEIVLTYSNVEERFIVDQEYQATTLLIDPDKTEFDYLGGSATISYVIQNPRKGLKVSASADEDWVTEFQYTDRETYGKISFTVLENNDSDPFRTSRINLSYGTIVESVSITQTSDSPVIKMVNEGVTCGYEESKYSFSYTIENPRQSFNVEISTKESWITGLTDNNGTVSFVVLENNSETDRDGEILVTYGNVSKKFIVIQKYVAVNLYAEADKTMFDYKGGSSIINYAIQNPRKGEKIGVSCNAEWIKGLAIHDNGTYGKIDFTVPVNEGIEEERMAQINVSYGTVVEQITIYQTNEAPIIQMVNGGVKCSYTEGTYNFTYTIQNPRESFTAIVSTHESWITGLTDKGGSVTFKVSENNDGYNRDGQIYITYGHVSTSFFVEQEYQRTILHIDSEKTDFDYKGGSSVINYAIQYPRNGAKLEVSCESSWVTGFRIDEGNNYGKIHFNVLENDGNAPSRTANVQITYGDVAETVTITQSNESPVIQMINGGMKYSYTEGVYNFTYTIDNPRGSYTPSVSTHADWISELSDNNGTVSFRLSENNDGNDRDTEITITYGNVKAGYYVLQEYLKPVIHVFSDNNEFNYKGGACVVNYVIENPRKGAKVEVSCDSPWVSGLTINEGVNSGTITFNIAENDGNAPSRTAAISVSYGTIGEIFNVIQSNESPAIKMVNEGMRYGYVEDSYNFTYTIENPRESLTAQCSANESWITDLNIGDGTVTFKLQENNSGNERMGEILLTYGSASKKFVVIQDYVAPILHVDTEVNTFDYKGGSSVINYAVQNPRKGVKVSVTCNQSWITGLTIDDSGTYGKIHFNIAENDGTATYREANITVVYGNIDEVITVSQTNNPPVINMQNGGMRYGYTEGTYNFTYTIENPRQSFTASAASNSSWITGVTDNNGTVSFTIAENNDGYEREGEVRITYGNVTRDFIVIQEYLRTNLFVDAEKSDFDYKGGTSYITYAIENPRKGAKIGVSCDAQWVSDLNIVEENNYGKIYFKVSENASDSEYRRANILVTYGNVGEPIQITQSNESPVIQMVNGGMRYGYVDGSYSFTYTIDNPRETYTASIASNTNWITGVTDNNGTVSFHISENNDGEERQGQIRVTYGNVFRDFFIIQEYLRPTIHIYTEKHEFDYKGGSSIINYAIENPRNGAKVSVYCEAPWVTDLTINEENNYGTISYKVAENNESITSRTANIIVAYATASEMLSITQTNNPPVINLTNGGMQYNYVEGSYNFTYTIENPRDSYTSSVAANADWIKDLRESNGTVSFKLTENNDGYDRNAEIRVTYGNVTKEYIVIQKYVSPAVSVHIEKNEFDYLGGSSIIHYVIENPRNGMKVSASCDSPWVTELRVNESNNYGTITFNVKGFDTEEVSRIANIAVSYGSVGEIIPITQVNNPPAIKLNIGGISCGYAEGTYNFTYTIENPRESWKANITTSANWITDIQDNNGVVSYKVAENNDGYARDAEIYISYGEVTARLYVQQEYKSPILYVYINKNEFDYKGGSSIITYYIDNPRKSAKVSATCNESWVTGLSVNEDSNTSGNITFNVIENVGDAASRTANISVTYGTIGELLTIYQTNESPVIEMTNGGMECGYTEGTYNFTYSIKNPRESYTASVSSNTNWITGVTDNNGMVSFNVSENNDGYDREGEITITYGNVIRTFVVMQKYVWTTLFVDADKSDFNYTGGSSFISYAIDNPRKGAKVNVSCDASWVTGLSIEDNGTYGKIYFNVTQNDGEAGSRSTNILVSYGTIGEMVPITQSNEAPIIKLPNGGMRYGYTEGSYDFTYTIENPRDAYTPTVSTNVGWITGLTINNGIVRFKISENNDGYDRDGEIIITYGNVTARYMVIQEYLSSIIHLYSQKTEFNYQGGLLLINYTIENPRKGLKISVSSDSPWLSDPTITEENNYGTISYNVSEISGNDNSRTAYVVVSYGTVREALSITQTNDPPVIKLPNGGMGCGYSEGVYSFTYEIENPREYLTPNLSSTVGWISNMSAANGAVTFQVAENNDGEQRDGEIRISYGNATATFVVVQEYTQPVIYLIDGHREFDYRGGSSSVTFLVQYPRKGIKANIACDQQWVTGITSEEYDSGGNQIIKISFNVAENNDKQDSRTAYIYVQYGSTNELAYITQSNATPVIKMDNTGGSFDYNPGSYNFTYTIENPRQSITPTVSADSYWITDLRINNGVVSFNLPANNDGQRVGQIFITYGDVTATFIVVQRYEEVGLYRVSGQTDIDKNGGTYSVRYIVRNPRNGMEPSISCGTSWITDIRYQKYSTSNENEIIIEVFYTVARNTTSASRSAYFYLSYGICGDGFHINQYN